MLVIGLIGGPGTGKSTKAAEIFAMLKKDHCEVELVTEYAKDLTWQESLKVLQNQIYVFAKQFHRIWRVKDKVDAAITDSPFLLSLSGIYLKEDNEALNNLVVQEWNKFDNMLFYLERTTDYNTKGRNESLEESIEVDNKILNALDKYSIEYHRVPDLDTAAPYIYDMIIERIKC